LELEGYSLTNSSDSSEDDEDIERMYNKIKIGGFKTSLAK
jgi:hypothetical protein